MSKRLQVLLPEDDHREIARLARAQHTGFDAVPGVTRVI
jgi:hypothetical protein